MIYYTQKARDKQNKKERKGDKKMLFWYGYYIDIVCAESYEEACEYFAKRYADFDAKEVWQD